MKGEAPIQYSADEIINGSLTVDQEREYWRESGRNYFLLALAKSKAASIAQIGKVRRNPTRETFTNFISYLTDLLDGVDYADSPSGVSENEFVSGKYMARQMLRESLEIHDTDIASIFTKRFDLLGDITLPN